MKPRFIDARVRRFGEYVAGQKEYFGRSTAMAVLIVVYHRLWVRSWIGRRIRLLALRSRIAIMPVALRVHLALGPETGSMNARLGNALMTLGRRDEALARWERALELDPELLELYEGCAIVYHFQGRIDDVVRMQSRGFEVQERLIRERQLDQVGFRFIHPSFSSVIGHIAELDVFVKQQLLIGRPLDEIVFLAPGRRAANSSYLGYWLPFFPKVIDDYATIKDLRPLASFLRLHFQVWPGFDGRLHYYYAVAHEAQRRWEEEERPPLLALSDEDRERGRARLESLGVPADAWFVGLHVREDRADRYLDSRNVDISTYRRAIEAVTSRGGWVVRMGDPTMTPLPPMERVVDYAHSGARSDWMDVFLWAEGRFLIGTHSGPAGVPQTFGKPVLQTNWLIGYPFFYSSDVYLPRLHWSEREQRHLTFREALSSPISLTLLGSELDRHGVRSRDNTPEELEEGVVEMLAQVEGAGAPSAEDEELRRCFESIQTPWEFPIPRGGARIGSGFLRRHAELLDDAP